MTKQEMISVLRGDTVFVGDAIGEIIDYLEQSEKVVYCEDCKLSRDCTPRYAMMMCRIEHGFCAAGERKDGEQE